MDYFNELLNAGFGIQELEYIKDHRVTDSIPFETFLRVLYDEVKKGKSLKQIRIENDLPVVFDEDEDGHLIPGYAGSITDPSAVPIALQMIKGSPAKTIDNFLEIFRNDPHYDNIRFNLMSNRAEFYDESSAKWETWSDTEDAKSRHYCESAHGLYQESRHRDAMLIFWRDRQMNPVTDMLNSLPPWDGVERCKYFLQRWLAADDSDFTRITGQILFDGAVSRAFIPGVKFDLVPVFIGEAAGEGKSTLIRWLALDDTFYGEIDDLDRDSKRNVEALSGKWIVELGEYLMRDAEKAKSSTKAFLTAVQDTYRKPYGIHTDILKRRNIFIASTNHREFLTDATGNRRWLPIITHSDGSLVSQEEEVKAEIRLCYAEAVARYRSNSCVLDIPAELRATVKERQELAVVEDSRIGIIEDYCRNLETNPAHGGSPFVCGLEIWKDALRLPDNEYTARQRREIKEIMRKIPFLVEEDTPKHTLHYGKQRVFRIDESKIQAAIE